MDVCVCACVCVCVCMCMCARVGIHFVRSFCGSCTGDNLPPFKEMQNIAWFLQACRNLGMPDSEVFVIIDLFESRDTARVCAWLVCVCV